MDIKWQEGSVCLAYGKQWFARDDKCNDLITWNGCGFASSSKVVTRIDFQLNTIKQGDYIEVSELDTEQKYDDAVEAFGLFGFCSDTSLKNMIEYGGLLVDDLVYFCSATIACSDIKRKLTYSQLMAIGKLKRLELEKSAPKITPDLTPDLVQNPSHYQFFEGVEVIEIIASSMTCEQFKGYCLGNRIKYRLRAGNKDKLEQEIAKSDKYVELYDEHKHLCRIDGGLK